MSHKLPPVMEVLISSADYLPGYKRGPIRSLSNLVDLFGNEFCFKIITRDRDSGDFEPYSGIASDSWQIVGKADVCYLSPRRCSFRVLRRLIRTTEHDVLYLNSFFDFLFTIKPLILRRLSLIPHKPVIVAPRGDFSPGALTLKSFKKRAYIVLARILRIYHGVIWQASSDYEEADIQRWFGDHIPVMVASNLPAPGHVEDEQLPRHEKIAGRLKVVFFSVISRKKNLDGALAILKGLGGKVEFNIYGPVDDSKYWMECQRLINSMPQNIEIQYRGTLAHAQVTAVMREHDLFFLPTLGENFGHAILEALVAGCPVLISDQTPWRDLKGKGVGWDLPLDQPEYFQNVLQQCVEMDAVNHRGLSQCALEYGLQFCRDENILEQNRALFCKAVSQL